MQTDKEKWVEDVLSSVDGANKASYDSLVSRVMARVSRHNVSKSEWVEEVMHSTEGVSRAVPVDMADVILSHISSGGRHSIAPAKDNSSVVFLLLLNGVAIYRYQSNTSQAENNHEMQTVASELGVGQVSSDAGTVIFGN